MYSLAGHLMTFEKKNDDENEDTDILLEVTKVNANGEIEIAFDDRNERCYIKFSLPEVIARVMLLKGEKE